jgi:U5 small nuclear ribonucleoprotein component
MDTEQFAARLWGNIYFNPTTRKFSKKPGEGLKRSFEHFVLEPLWKLYSQVSGRLTFYAVRTLALRVY